MTRDRVAGMELELDHFLAGRGGRGQLPTRHCAR